MSIYPPQYLTSEEVEHFLHNGYIHLKGCFTRETAKRWTDDLWIRLGYSPTDPSTWLTDRINMPSHRSESIKNLAPTAWLAICDLLGGEDRVTPESSNWNDALIVNLGSASKNCSYDDEWNEPKDLRGWHVDGDSFFHFLNSPEQALLVIPLFSDIKPHGGGTIICPQGIPVIAKHLYEHPEGVSPHMTPKGASPSTSANGLSFFNSVPQNCDNFVEATGDIGDVYLLHPLMMHTASRNVSGVPRVITNPPVSIKEPFQFHRTDGSLYSIVELKTLTALGHDEKDGLPNWTMRGKPERVIPERELIQRRMKEMELRRLGGEQVEPGMETGLSIDESDMVKTSA